ncbi:MAG: transcriptional repressor [Deltaproteobacteria bacterium]|nr:transcriptional repressor [Deltaproteobacteria bacterium]
MTSKELEKENFRSLIENDGIGYVEERLNIIDVFLDTEEHVTLDDLLRLLRERGYNYDPDFVRQCMNRWVERGFAQKKVFEGQPPRYEHRHLGKHHDHLICTKCGKIVEFDNEEMERLQMRIAATQGFHVLQHKMEIYGLCADCTKERGPVMPLAMAKPGERVVVNDIMGGREARSRLATMGIRPGDSLEVINNNGMGRLIVGHGNTRLALGRGIAQKILVSPQAHE